MDGKGWSEQKGVVRAEMSELALWRAEEDFTFAFFQTGFLPQPWH